MNEKQLSIEQVEKIMGWSYPTALKFANRHGEMVNGKWHVPNVAVNEEIFKLEKTARFIRARYEVAIMKEPAS